MKVYLARSSEQKAVKDRGIAEERVTSTKRGHTQNITVRPAREKKNLVYIEKRLPHISQKRKRCRPSDSKFREHGVVRNPLP